jgi:hypothetical protein
MGLIKFKLLSIQDPEYENKNKLNNYFIYPHEKVRNENLRALRR